MTSGSSTCVLHLAVLVEMNHDVEIAAEFLRPDPEFGWGHSCSEFGGTGRPDGTAFRFARHAFLYRKHVPEELQERDHRRAARLGNRSKKFGGDVVVVHLDKDGKVKNMEPLVTGFLEDNKYIGRPNDVLQLKDGSMLISDDWNGAVYRVTYGKPKVAAQ